MRQNEPKKQGHNRKVSTEIKNLTVLEERESENEDEEYADPSEKTAFMPSRFHVVRSNSARYSWKQFSPDRPADFLSWLVRGFSPQAKLSAHEVEESFRKLARMLLLLREYEARFGLPEMGGSRDQQNTLQDICRQLYEGGVPIWSLQPVMERAAFGLTGAKGVDFCLFPRCAFIFAPSSGATVMFRMVRGFHMHKTTLMERILIRIASFGSNTSTVNSLPSEFPHPDLFRRPPRGQSAIMNKPREMLAEQILDLASEGTGLFFYTHAQGYPSSRHARDSGIVVDSFWQVEDSIKELFKRLATIEAEISMDAANEQISSHDAKYYPRYAILTARVIAAMGATGLWFSGSWYDMAVAGILAFFVAVAQGSSIWKHERFIFEVIVSLLVGWSAGLISLAFPERTCFGAMAVGSIVDILQGFKIVYAIMELMSKHTLAGGADFMEAFLFTGLIASFLKFGQYLASTIMGAAAATGVTTSIDLAATQCTQPIGEQWYPLLLPISTLMWAYLFMPRVSDIWVMALHGMLSFGVYYGMDKASGQPILSTFCAALSVTFSAGLVSRFSGRQALGDTVTGLYALVPGAYLARGLFEAATANSISPDLMYNIIVNSVLIGLGAWTGTILCSPTILGTNRGLLNFNSSKAGGANRSNNKKEFRHAGGSSSEGLASPMLFF